MAIANSTEPGQDQARVDPLRRLTTPLNAPAYPMLPYHFVDREYLRIAYRTDADALRSVVPEPLVVGDPVVRFEVIRMPDSTGLGSYHECGQIAVVEHEGRVVDYNLGSVRRQRSSHPQRSGVRRVSEEGRLAASIR